MSCTGVQHTVTEARLYLLLRKTALLKLGLDLISQFLKVMIWGASVKKIMVSFVQVFGIPMSLFLSLYMQLTIVMPVFVVNVCSFYAADLLRLESSAADDIDKLAINELFEVCYSISWHYI